MTGSLKTPNSQFLPRSLRFVLCSCRVVCCGQRKFAVILLKPTARAIWPQTSDDRGRGPYIRCICHTSHGSYDIFYSTCVDYVWLQWLFRSVIWIVAAPCCLLLYSREGEWRCEKKKTPIIAESLQLHTCLWTFSSGNGQWYEEYC